MSKISVINILEPHLSKQQQQKKIEKCVSNKFPTRRKKVLMMFKYINIKRQSMPCFQDTVFYQAQIRQRCSAFVLILKCFLDEL